MAILKGHPKRGEQWRQGCVAGLCLLCLKNSRETRGIFLLTWRVGFLGRAFDFIIAEFSNSIPKSREYKKPLCTFLSFISYQLFFFFLAFCFVLFLYWSSLCRPGCWLRTQRDPLACAFRMLGLKTCHYVWLTVINILQNLFHLFSHLFCLKMG